MTELLFCPGEIVELLKEFVEAERAEVALQNGRGESVAASLGLAAEHARGALAKLEALDAQPAFSAPVGSAPGHRTEPRYQRPGTDAHYSSAVLADEISRLREALTETLDCLIDFAQHASGKREPGDSLLVKAGKIIKRAGEVL